MILTDVKKEIIGCKNAEGLSWQDLGDRLGINRQSARHRVEQTENFIPKSVVEILEVMGYDIEIEFVRRK